MATTYTRRLTPNQRKALASLCDAEDWMQTPRDGGQIVDVTYASTEYYAYEWRDDRSDRTSVVIAYRTAARGEWEPWNGRVPLGRRIGVIYDGPSADVPVRRG